MDLKTWDSTSESLNHVTVLHFDTFVLEHYIYNMGKQYSTWFSVYHVRSGYDDESQFF